MTQAQRYVPREGSALVIILASLGVIMMMAAYAINVAYMQLVRTELQATSDAAARAGAEALARTDSTGTARLAAINNAAINRVAGLPLVLSSGDIQVGRATLSSGTGKWNFLQDQPPFSAVRVNADCSATLMFAGLTGRSNVAPNTSSTAAYAENEVCLVIDRSHSMCFDLTGVALSYPPATPLLPDPVVYPPDPMSSRWAALAQGVNSFLNYVDAHNTGQRMSLVTWGSTITLAEYEGALTGLTFPATILDIPLGTGTSPIRTAIAARGLNTMLGGTNMSAGIDLGVQVLTGPGSRASANKIMVLMTDGRWNMGRDPLLAAQDAKLLNITIHTITFLDAADQTDMVSVAAATGGQHHHASNAAQLQQIFVELARSLPTVLIN